MVVLFKGEVKTRGVKGSLMSEEGSATAKGPTVSMMFKIEKGQKAKDDHGRPIEVDEIELAAYFTVTENTRERIIDSLVHAGMRRAIARQFIENTEQGDYGGVDAEKSGFGGKVCSLTVEIDEYKGKKKTKVQWVNGPEGGRASKSANAPKMEIDYNAPDDDAKDDDIIPY
jgi:hypothetical protein